MVTVLHYTPVNTKQFDGLNIDGLAGKHQKHQNFALYGSCTSNSQVIAQGEAECNFDCCKYNYSLIVLKYIRLPTNHIALSMNSILTLRIAMNSN